MPRRIWGRSESIGNEQADGMPPFIEPTASSGDHASLRRRPAERTGGGTRAATVDRWAAGIVGTVARGLEPILPVECAVCGTPAVNLCSPCRRLLHRITATPLRVESGARHARGLPIVAGGAYEHELAACILALKQGGRTDLLPVLGPVLIRAIGAAVGAGQLTPKSTWTSPGPESSEPVGVALVPVPTSSRALRKRWFDPVAEILAEALRLHLLPPQLHAVPWLVHRSRDPSGVWAPARAVLRRGAQRDLGPQKLRSADQRGRGEGPRFRVATGRTTGSGRPQRPGTVILIDDVVTTGATLHQARLTLESAGATVLGAVVLAAANTPSGNRP